MKIIELHTVFAAFFFVLIGYADTTPPVEVVIIGVPGIPGMSAYKESPLGPKAVSLCESLKALFNDPRVHVTPFCTPNDTTFQVVQDFLTTYAQADQHGRLTLLFIMTHGETTANGDVRLLMSDTTDQNKVTRSLLLRTQIAQWLTSIPGSIAIGFIDACHSGAADNPELAALGPASIDAGTYAGLMASAQANQLSYQFSFTNALIGAWKQSCPQNEDDFISEVLQRLTDGSATPHWLIPFHGSECFQHLLNPDKRLFAIWRDPSRNVRVLLFDQSHPDTPIWQIPPGRYVMPYLSVLPPGTYHVVTQDVATNNVLDQTYCSFNNTLYCEYSYPAAAPSIVALNTETQLYAAGTKLGYTTEQLGLVSSRVSLLYGDVIARQSKAPHILGLVTERLKAHPRLWADVQAYQQGGKTPYSAIVGKVGDTTSRDAIASGLKSMTNGDTQAGALWLQDAGKTLNSDELMSAGKAVATEGLSPKTLDSLEGAVKASAKKPI